MVIRSTLGVTYRLVGFDTPETFRAKCAAERVLGKRAAQRLEELVDGGGLDLQRVRCSCPDEYFRPIRAALTRVAGMEIAGRLFSESAGFVVRIHAFRSTVAPSWANRSNLDEAARILKSDPQIGLDLTFLIRNASTGYPSVIDGKPYDPNDPAQKTRARAVANQIIAQYKLKVANPY